MKLSFLLPIFCILVFLSARCQEAPPLPITGEVGELSPQQMDKISETLSLFPENTQLALAIIEGEEVAFVGVEKKAESLEVVANQEALFEIGSISKVFTGTLLAQMVQAGKLSLDESIDEQFDIPLEAGVTITFAQLANHTSGLPRIPASMGMSAFYFPDNPYRAFTDEKMEEYLASGPAPSASQVGTYSYSNLAVGMLAYLIGKMEDKDYSTLLDERIFTPLGMENSYGDWRLVEDGIVPGQNLKGNPTANWDMGPLS
ncbi:MAG: serine hydrolase, partial [Bacteroidota bacterium]